MIAVLEHRLPDRVPLMELWIDPKVVNAILPGATSNGLVEHLGMDVVTVPTMIYDDDEVEWIEVTESKRIFRDKWGGLQALTTDAVPHQIEPARIEEDEDMARYEPPDPRDSTVPAKIRALKEQYPGGEKAICVVGESGWAPAADLRGGLQNLLLDFGLRPEFAKELMRFGRDYYSELYPVCIEAGADIILLGDDYSDKNGPMMSPAQFDDIILPSDTAVVASIKNAGGYCIKHTDGNIRKIIDQLVGTGLDCLGPLEDVPHMELDGILNLFPGKLAVMGNLSVDLLARGSREEVVRATKRLLATTSAIGPHIMSSGNTIASYVSPENFLAMIETTKEHGVYPIDREKLLAELD